MRKLFISSFAVIFTLATTLSYAAEASKGFKAYPNIVDYKFMSEHAVVPIREDVTVIAPRSPALRGPESGCTPAARRPCP